MLSIRKSVIVQNTKIILAGVPRTFRLGIASNEKNRGLYKDFLGFFFLRFTRNVLIPLMWFRLATGRFKAFGEELPQTTCCFPRAEKSM